MPLDFGVSEVLAAGAIVSAVASAGSAAYGAVSASQRAEFEAQQYREEKDFERVAALEQEVERMRQLEQIQAAQLALRGTNFYEGSSLAIRREDERVAAFDIAGIQLDSARRQRKLDLQLQQTKQAGNAALYGGIFTSVSSLAQAAYGGAKLIPGAGAAPAGLDANGSPTVARRLISYRRGY